jgi:hypothetical protein
MSGPATPAANWTRFIEQQEITMKKFMGIVAIAMALVGSANLAMAQAFQDQGVVTGSESNRAEHANGGEYTNGR